MGARVSVLLLLLAGTAVSWWLLHGLGTAPPERPAAARHVADYSMRQFTVNAMNSDGRLDYRLHGARMSHYLDDDTARVEQPNMTVYKDNDPIWNVYARHGWIAADQKSIVLHGEVLIWRNPIGGPALEIQTDNLHIAPDRQYAETASPVTITQAIGVTRAVGMRVDLEQNTLVLLASVQGSYTLRGRADSTPP
jgi:lipopolysaccharide export system protein LptC